MINYPRVVIGILLAVLLLGFVSLVFLREVAKRVNVKEKEADITVLIPEGFTIEKIQSELEKAGIAGAVRFEEVARPERWREEFEFLAAVPSSTRTLEGFLFPDTYRFWRQDTAETIVRKFLENFEARTKGLRVTYEIVTVASILEREVSPEDMALAAGVLIKRLRSGVALQADATLVYALGRPINRSDPEIFDSLYNTYRYAGLPPTPISNPGLAAIKAAVNPQTSDYWYYLSRPSDGKTIFSRTLEEHNEARAKYLR